MATITEVKTKFSLFVSGTAVHIKSPENLQIITLRKESLRMLKENWEDFFLGGTKYHKLAYNKTSWCFAQLTARGFLNG